MSNLICFQKALLGERSKTKKNKELFYAANFAILYLKLCSPSLDVFLQVSMHIYFVIDLHSFTRRQRC